MKLSVLISKEEQLNAALSDQVFRVYLEADAVPYTLYPEISELLKAHGKEIFLALPRILTPEAEKFLKIASESVKKACFTGFLARSAEEPGYLKELGIEGVFASDYSLYSFNSESRKVLYDFGFSFVTVPLELNGREISEVGFTHDEMVVYGRYPMMVTRNCIHKTLEGCDGKRAERILTDRMKNRLPVENHCRYCLNLIYNSLPTSLLAHAGEICSYPLDSVRLEFSFETEPEAEARIGEFAEAFLFGGAGKKPGYLYTNGHFTRGVD